MSAIETSLNPACLMMPSSSRALTAANCASRGTFGSMRCSCQSPICSRPSLWQLLIACSRKYFGSPSVSHTPGPGRLNPALVAIRIPS